MYTFSFEGRRVYFEDVEYVGDTLDKGVEVVSAFWDDTDEPLTDDELSRFNDLHGYTITDMFYEMNNTSYEDEDLFDLINNIPEDYY